LSPKSHSAAISRSCLRLDPPAFQYGQSCPPQGARPAGIKTKTGTVCAVRAAARGTFARLASAACRPAPAPRAGRANVDGLPGARQVQKDGMARGRGFAVFRSFPRLRAASSYHEQWECLLARELKPACTADVRVRKKEKSGPDLGDSGRGLGRQLGGWCTRLGAAGPLAATAGIFFFFFAGLGFGQSVVGQLGAALGRWAASSAADANSQHATPRVGATVDRGGGTRADVSGKTRKHARSWHAKSVGADSRSVETGGNAEERDSRFLTRTRSS